MKLKFTLPSLLGFAAWFSLFSTTAAQNVGIGIAAPLERLHVAGNVRVNPLAGVGVRLAGADANGTLVIVAAGTNGQVLTQTAAGPAFQNAGGSVDWAVLGNAGLNGGTTLAAGTNFVGTTDNQNLDFRTNNIFRGRISNLGEFFIGTLNTVLTGDLMNGVGNAAFPWAVNGYTAFNGAGVYGQVTAGTTIFAGVQGETSSTNASAAGVRGIDLVGTAGTSLAAPRAGVSGDVANVTGTFKFGVLGAGGNVARTGGVLGNDFGLAMGSLGYYASNATDYSVYGFGLAYTTGAVAGRSSGQQPIEVGMTEPNSHVGLGIYGGVMGGWVRGMRYGFHVKGERTSLYVDGSAITNKPINQLVTLDDGSRVSTFVPSSTSADVFARGKSKLAAGQIYISFTDDFKQIFADPQALTITVTPAGNSNGVYVSAIDANGFWVKENNNGTSHVDLSWIAMGTRKDAAEMTVSPEILDADFDIQMNGVMHNDMSSENATPLWWDGTQMRHDALPARALKPRAEFIRAPEVSQR
jgi:hypothetical protein